MKISNLKLEVSEFKMDIADLNIERGFKHAFVGPNGSGKSTLAKAIMQIIPNHSVDLEGLSSIDIMLAPQRPYLLHDTVMNNILYPLKIRNRKVNNDELISLLDMFNLTDKKNQYARSLSSGEQQKVSLIRCLLCHPVYLIIDEALSNLDSESVMRIEEIIKNDKETTWILISHQLTQVLNICDKVHFLDKGKLIESGDTEEVLLKSKNEIIQNYMSNQVIKVRE
ncbi:MAG: ABC transporter ATP-binding protein [Erysipelotrichales bacterium]|nr:ABC transporter ATP-binding protein [Erysipelotrichales bacterium]